MSTYLIGGMFRRLEDEMKRGASDESTGNAIIQIVEAAMELIVEKQLANASIEGAMGRKIDYPEI